MGRQKPKAVFYLGGVSRLVGGRLTHPACDRRHTLVASFLCTAGNRFLHSYSQVRSTGFSPAHGDSLPAWGSGTVSN